MTDLPMVPLGWLKSPHGSFAANPATRVAGPALADWAVPVYTESQVRDYVAQQVAAERERIVSLLAGIDATENESPHGWWETSTGAEFGAGILAAIRKESNHG